MATDLTLNGGIAVGGDITLGGDLTATGAVIGASAAFVGACGADELNSTGPITNPKAKITAEGGYAIKLTNKTGAPTVKGTVVAVYTATAVDNAFKLAPVDSLDPVGVVYEDGIADGSAAYVVVSGIAEVLFKAATTRGQIARVGVSADNGEAAGYAMPMAVPANPNVAVDDHFREIGHILESKDADALCKVVLHFN